jgi:hypothetical protein
VRPERERGLWRGQAGCTRAGISGPAERHPIIPGMIATTEIKTGHKTVMDYLLKPFNKASEALRER